MIRLTQILGTGMHPQASIDVNPQHIMTIQPRKPTDGYGHPQHGSKIQMVTGWTCEVTEAPGVVCDAIHEATP